VFSLACYVHTARRLYAVCCINKTICHCLLCSSCSCVLSFAKRTRLLTEVVVTALVLVCTYATVLCDLFLTACTQRTGHSQLLCACWAWLLLAFWVEVSCCRLVSFQADHCSLHVYRLWSWPPAVWYVA
jgi:hypothetical protein